MMPIIYKIVLVLAISVLVYFIFIFCVKSIFSFYLHNKYPLNYEKNIEKCLADYNLTPSLVAAIIYEESRFRADSNSTQGAVGLMQLLPETAEYIAKKIDEGNFEKEKLADVEINIKYGCYYLAYLFEKYQDWDKALAAYNAGEGNIDQWVNEGDYQVKFEETRNFVDRVKKSQEIYQELYFEKE